MVAADRQVSGLFWQALLVLTIVLCFTSPAWAKNDLLQLPAIKSSRAVDSLLLDVTRAGQRLVAVGERGHVLLSDDNGLNWRQALVPVSVTLTAVEFPSAQKGWAVGHDGVVLHSNDGGENWALNFDGNQANQLLVQHLEAEVVAKEAEMKLLSAEEQDEAHQALENLRYDLDDARYAVKDGPWKPFLDVAFLDETTGFVVGAYGLIFRTADGGASWQPWGDRIDNPDKFHYNAISAAGDKLFIAGESGTLYRSRDGGENWETLESPYEGSFFGVICDPRGEQVAAMGLRGKVFRSSDGGTTWQRLDTTVERSINGGVVLGDGRLALASGTLLLSDGQGQVRPVSGVKGSAYAAVTETADGHLLLVGIHGARRIEERISDGGEK